MKRTTQAVATVALLFIMPLFSGCLSPTNDPPETPISITPTAPGDAGFNPITYKANFQRTGVYETKGVRQYDELGWRVGTPFWLECKHAFPLGGVLYTSCYGDFYALDIKTGETLWQLKDVALSTPPTEWGGLLYFGSTNRLTQDDWSVRLAVVDPKSRSVVREFEVGEGVSSSPVIVGDTLYFLTEWSTLYAIDPVTGEERWKFDKRAHSEAWPWWDSAIAYADGLLYFTNYGEDHMSGDLVPGNGHLYAIDAATGAEVWKFPTEVASPPVVSEGTVYVGTDGNLVALDAKTGHEKWDRPGAQGSPAVLDGVIYTGSEGALLALDANTGAEMWSLSVPHRIQMPASIADGVIYFAGGDDRHTFYAVDLVARQVIWTFKTAYFPRPALAPVITNGMIFLNDWTSIYALRDSTSPKATAPSPQPQLPTSSPMFRGNPQHIGAYAADGVLNLAGTRWKLKLSGGIKSSPAILDGTLYVGTTDGLLYALDVDSGRERWRFKAGGGIASSPAVADGLVVFGSDDSYLYALDVSTGRKRWKFKTEADITSSPSIEDGAVYFGSKDKHLYSVELTTGKERWKFSAQASLTTSPAVSGGMVYFGNSNCDFFALDSATGHKRWSLSLVNQITSAPAVADGKVYFGALYNVLFVVDAQSGRIKWTFQAGTGDSIEAAIATSPAVVADTVFFGNDDAYIYAVNSKTTQERWRYRIWGPVKSAPSFASGILYVGGTDGNLYALEAVTGKEKWKFRAEAAVTSSPVIYGDRVYFGDEDGYLYALQSSTLAAAFAARPIPTFVPGTPDCNML